MVWADYSRFKVVDSLGKASDFDKYSDRILLLHTASRMRKV